MSRPIVQLDDVEVRYDDVLALRGLSLEIGEGEIVALLGANGAGKTTALHTLVGRLSVSGGRALVDGIPMGSRRPHDLARLGIRLVPDSRGIFNELTVAENLRLGARQRKPDVRHACRLFPELEPLLPRRAGQLSGGEQQMLALAAALASRPRLLLVDELSMGLAPRLVSELGRSLKVAVQRDGLAVLVVEQHVAVALDLAQRAYVLRRGALAVSGETAQLAASYDHLVSAYLGNQAGLAGSDPANSMP